MKKIILVIMILLTTLLSGCTKEAEVTESYFTIEGILYDYNKDTYKLYRFETEQNHTYMYDEKLSYDIAKQLEKGEKYYFDYLLTTKTYPSGNMYHSSDLLLIRDFKNATIWRK